ncbi:MAG TPA: DUF177 domain-containing protein [Stellaceae bacterium]|nr:DUF177 domain-containing protein [Stellaceae bacterium]
MSSEVASPEFSRPVSAGRLSATPSRHPIVADPAERAALARRFDLISLDRLEAVVMLTRRSDGTVQLDAEFSADLAQACVVTLEPVPASLADSVTVIFDPELDEDAADALALQHPEEEIREPLTEDAIDIGEVVAQQLSIVMEPYPRLPGVSAGDPADTQDRPTGSDGDAAEVKRDAEPESVKPNPFAVLVGLKRSP